MSLVFFGTPSDRTGKAIMEAIKAQLPGEAVEVCPTVESLERNLGEHRDEERIAILVPGDEEELIDIYSKKDMFDRVPLIVVLPSRDRFVEAMGYRLKPRLLCHRGGNVTDVVSKFRSVAGSLHRRNAVA